MKQFFDSREALDIMDKLLHPLSRLINYRFSGT